MPIVCLSYLVQLKCLRWGEVFSKYQNYLINLFPKSQEHMVSTHTSPQTLNKKKPFTVNEQKRQPSCTERKKRTEKFNSTQILAAV